MILMLQALRQLTHSASSQAEMAPGSAALLAPTEQLWLLHRLGQVQSGSSAVWVKCVWLQMKGAAPPAGHQ